jgi:phosphoenolpyruvate carboxylase
VIEERIRLLAKARRADETAEQPDGLPPKAAARQLQTAVKALSNRESRSIANAFSVYFDLVNIAEEYQRIKILRERAVKQYPAPVNASIAHAVQLLKEQNVTPAQLSAVLHTLQIEIVLTAHPTEAKRRTILSKLQRISQHLGALTAGPILPNQVDELHQNLISEITGLWLTNRNRTMRPLVTDEVRTGMYFVESVFWRTFPKIYADLQKALDQHYPGLKPNPKWLQVASWMGGDRDGNPFVTASVTAETLRLHRGLAVRRLHEAVRELARHFSFSSRLLKPAPELLEWIDSRRPLPPDVAHKEERYPDEPYRLALDLIANDLDRATHDDMQSRLFSEEPHDPFAKLSEIQLVIDLLEQAVPKIVAKTELRELQAQLNIFGLYAARLDMREDSGVLNAAVAEILRALRVAPDLEALNSVERAAILSKVLEQPVPDLPSQIGVTQRTHETWRLFRLLARAGSVYGKDGLGPFIISMCTCAADVLAVLMLARWAGCAGGMQIVPLFETIADLKNAPDVLTELFTHPIYKQHLQSCNNEQMVMIGYSDSNKDGGPVTALWGLYQGQETIAAVCEAHHVRLTLFHGRGGTIARGGGPLHRAIFAQPPNTVQGRFRVTEQGEVITARYGNPELAHRHLEQIVHAVLLKSQPVEPDGQGTDSSFAQPAWRSALTQMSGAAYHAYRQLVYDTPNFGDYWRYATPLEELGRLHIGSRPAKRGQSGQFKITNIRAIPWVFSWMQSRHNLPSWFGFGSGLSAVNDLPLFRAMYTEWQFFHAMLDNAEMALSKSDMGIAELYAELVPDQTLAAQIFTVIKNEFNLTQEWVLRINGASHLLANEPYLEVSVKRRNPYIDPLNYLQIEMLRRMRALPDPDSKTAQQYREVLQMTVNGIAAGLRNTG